MNYPWKMVPRYHPQMSARDVGVALLSRRKDLHSVFECAGIGLQGDRLFLLNGATAGLTVGLKALGLPAGSGVAVPIFTCVTVFEAVAAAGLRCVFIDVTGDSFRLDLRSLAEHKDEISAVIAVHTFGYPEDIEKIVELLPGCPVVEDCSHAAGSASLGRPVGSRGVFGVFSFNFNKPISAGGGGVLCVNDADYLVAVERALGDNLKRSRHSALIEAMSLALKTSIYRSPWYGIMAACRLIDLNRDGALSSEVRIERMSRINHVVLSRVTGRISNRCEMQRSWAQEVSRILGDPLPLRHFATGGSDWNGYLLPVLVDSPARRKESLDYFHRHNVDAFVLWRECLRTARRFGYEKGQCSSFEDAFDRLLFVPCYAEMSEGQRRRMLGVFSKWYGSVGISES